MHAFVNLCTVGSILDELMNAMLDFSTFSTTEAIFGYHF